MVMALERRVPSLRLAPAQPLGYGVALASSLAAAFVARSLALLPQHALLWPFLLAVAVTSWSGGFRPALLATGASGFLIYRLSQQPASLATFGNASPGVNMALFIVAAAILTGLHEHLRAAYRRAEAARSQAEAEHAAARAALDEVQQAQTRLAHLASIVEASDDAMIGLTLDGRIMAWNPAAERLFGRSAAQVLGQPVQQVASLDTADPLASLPSRAAAGERIAYLETTVTRPDDSPIDVVLSLSPIAGASEAAMIVRDITSLRQLEAKRQQAARLEGALVVARTIADRVYNQLAATVVGCELVATDERLPPDLTSVAQKAASQALQAGATIKQLLRLTRLEELDHGSLGSTLDIARSIEAEPAAEPSGTLPPAV